VRVFQHGFHFFVYGFFPKNTEIHAAQFGKKRGIFIAAHVDGVQNGGNVPCT
jgi:hypothetical protein